MTSPAGAKTTLKAEPHELIEPLDLDGEDDLELLELRSDVDGEDDEEEIIIMQGAEESEGSDNNCEGLLPSTALGEQESDNIPTCSNVLALKNNPLRKTAEQWRNSHPHPSTQQRLKNSLLKLTSDALPETMNEPKKRTPKTSERDRETGCTKECRNRMNWYQDEIEQLVKRWKEVRALMALEIKSWLKDEELIEIKSNEWEKERQDLLEQINRHKKQEEMEKSQLQEKNLEIIILKKNLEQFQKKAVDLENLHKKLEDQQQEMTKNMAKAIHDNGILERQKNLLNAVLDQQRKMNETNESELNGRLEVANKLLMEHLNEIKEKEMENESLKKKCDENNLDIQNKLETTQKKFISERNERAKAELLLKQVKKELDEYRRDSSGQKNQANSAFSAKMEVDIEEKNKQISELKMKLSEKEEEVSEGRKKIAKLQNELKHKSKQENLALFKNSQELHSVCRSKLEEEKNKFVQMEAEREKGMTDYRTDIANKMVEIKLKKKELDDAIYKVRVFQLSKMEESNELRIKNENLNKDNLRYASAVKVLHMALAVSKEKKHSDLVTEEQSDSLTEKHSDSVTNSTNSSAHEHEDKSLRQSNAQKQQNNGGSDGENSNNSAMRGRTAPKRNFKQELMEMEDGEEQSTSRNHSSPRNQKRIRS